MMRSTGGVKMNWPLVAIAFAVIGVPMGVAVIQDLGSDRDDDDLLAKIGQVNDITADEPTSGDPDQDRLERADDLEGTWTEPAMDQAFFDEVFLGGPEETKPALRGPLAGLEWGAPPAVQPDLSRWPRASAELRAAGFADRTSEVGLTFPDDGTAARVLASRWGDPLLAVSSDDLARRIWTDPVARLRVTLESHDGEANATFAPYVPAADYVAPGRGFAFERHPILGSTSRRLAAEYGTALKLYPGGGTAEIDCPRVELSARRPTCLVWFAGGEAVKVVVAIDHSFDPQAGPQLFAALRDALGPVRDQTSDESDNRWTFADGFSVTQQVGLQVITVEHVAR